MLTRIVLQQLVDSNVPDLGEMGEGGESTLTNLIYLTHLDNII